MDKNTAVAFIRDRAATDIPPANQPRFIEVAETELMNLHQGNMARYRLRPSQYQSWKQNWQ